MVNQYLTEDEKRISREMQQAKNLRDFVFNSRSRGILGAIKDIVTDMRVLFTGVEKIIQPQSFVELLVQSGFATNYDQAREEVLPTMENHRLCYYTAQGPECSDIARSISIQKVKDSAGNEAYRITDYHGY